MKTRFVIAGATATLIAIMYLMLSFYSTAFNISLWRDGARLAFSLIGGFIGFVGTITVVAHYDQNEN